MRTLSPLTAPCLESRTSSANFDGSFPIQERSSIRNNTRSLGAVKPGGIFAERDFCKVREGLLDPIKLASTAWNASVAELVSQVGRELTPLATRQRGGVWHERVAKGLRDMREPLHSDIILSTRAPLLKNNLIRGLVRVFCSAVLEQDLEFMPRPMQYPKFPYFTVEPATQKSLYEAGLYLLANPPGTDEDEPNVPGTPINRSTYLRAPMVSVELELAELSTAEDGAVLLNWSFRGRAGAEAKIFINGEQDVPAFDVMSTEDDAVPNFWTFLPWKAGMTVIDLKHVGSGYLWFEHVDVHHVRWVD